MKPLLALVVLTLLLLAAITLSPAIGDEDISASVIVQSIFSPNDPTLDVSHVSIVREIRLPRILLAALIGAGLAAAGAGYQGLFRNPLADPFVIGASSGAALGATVAIIGFATFAGGAVVEDAPVQSEAALQVWGFGRVSLFAMAGALLAVGLVYSIATVGGQAPVTSLLLAGVAVSSCLTAVVSLLMFLNNDSLFRIVGWLMGSIALAGWPQLLSCLPIIVIGVLLLLTMSRGLDALSFGDESAAALGLRLNLMRGIVVVAASLATAAAVAVAGVIGFVGLIAPHAARLLVGPKHAILIPASCLLGALLLVLADDLARSIRPSSEVPLGIVTALLGGPFFLYLMKTRQRNTGLGSD